MLVHDIPTTSSSLAATSALRNAPSFSSIYVCVDSRRIPYKAMACRENHDRICARSRAGAPAEEGCGTDFGSMRGNSSSSLGTRSIQSMIQHGRPSSELEEKEADVLLPVRYFPLTVIFEVAQRIWKRFTLASAVHMKNNEPVILKQVEINTSEFELAVFFSSPPLSTDPRNHCVPIYDVLQFGKYGIIVMPQLRQFNDAPFDTVGEVLECFRQILEVSDTLTVVTHTSSKIHPVSTGCPIHASASCRPSVCFPLRSPKTKSSDCPAQ